VHGTSPEKNPDYGIERWSLETTTWQASEWWKPHIFTNAYQTSKRGHVFFCALLVTVHITFVK